MVFVCCALCSFECCVLFVVWVCVACFWGLCAVCCLFVVRVYGVLVHNRFCVDC